MWWATLLIDDSFELSAACCYQFDIGLFGQTWGIFFIRQRFGNIVLCTTTRFSVFCDTFLWWQTLLICDFFELFKAECYQFDTGLIALFLPSSRIPQRFCNIVLKALAGFLCFARVFCNDKFYWYWSVIPLSFLKLIAISLTTVWLLNFVLTFRIRQRFFNIVLITSTRFSVWPEFSVMKNLLILICDSFELFKADCYQFDTAGIAEFCANVSDPPTLR